MEIAPVQIIFTTLLISFVVFLIAREIMCCYFKINIMVARMDTMIKHLEAINKFLQVQQPFSPTLPPPTTPSVSPQNRSQGISPTRPIP